jgi:hypothetical protein
MSDFSWWFSPLYINSFMFSTDGSQDLIVPLLSVAALLISGFFIYKACRMIITVIKGL